MNVSAERAVAPNPAVSVEASEPSAPARHFRTAWAVLGFVAFALGAVGVVIPVFPTTPFVLVAAFCFARSSERLNTWFKGTALYRKVLEGYVSKRSMTVRAKLSIIVPVTVLLTVGFMLMANVPVGRAALVLVWLGHVVYFGFVVKTDRSAAAAE